MRTDLFAKNLCRIYGESRTVIFEGYDCMQQLTSFNFVRFQISERILAFFLQLSRAEYQNRYKQNSIYDIDV